MKSLLWKSFKNGPVITTQLNTTHSLSGPRWQPMQSNHIDVQPYITARAECLCSSTTRRRSTYLHCRVSMQLHRHSDWSSCSSANACSHRICSTYITHTPHTYTHTHSLTHTNTNRHAHTHTRTHTHTHTHTQGLKSMRRQSVTAHPLYSPPYQPGGADRDARLPGLVRRNDPHRHGEGNDRGGEIQA